MVKYSYTEVRTSANEKMRMYKGGKVNGKDMLFMREENRGLWGGQV